MSNWSTYRPALGARLDPSQPLSKGLVGYWLFNEGAGNLVNDLSPYRTNLTLSTGSIAATWGDGGLYMVVLGARAGIAPCPNILKPVNEVTAVWEGVIFGAGTASVGLIGTSYTSSNLTPFDGYFIDRNSANTGDLRFFYNNAGTANNIVAFGATNFGARIQVAATFRSGFQGLYVNGNLLATATAAGVISYLTSEFDIGDFTYSGTRNPNCVTYMGAVYNRCLNGGEIRSLNADPYQMLNVTNGYLLKTLVSQRIYQQGMGVLSAM